MSDPAASLLDPYLTALNDARTKAPILADEMAEAVDYLLARTEQSVRAAMAAYHVEPHPETMRRIAALEKALDVMRRMALHRNEVVPILFSEEIEAAERERRYQAKKTRERAA